MVTVIMSIFNERRAQRGNGILRWPFKITGPPKFLGGLNWVVSSREHLVPQKSCIAALTLSVLLLSVAGVNAANNWYVVPGGAGNKGGTAWTNAWDVSCISWSSVGAGDTIWLAGGTYSSALNVKNSGSSGNPIYIKRVLASDNAPANSPGWRSGFDSLVVLPLINVPNNNYITIDGRVTYGIQVQPAGEQIIIGSGGSCSYLQFLNMEVLGSYNTNTAGYGIFSCYSVWYCNLQFSNMWIHGMAEGITCKGWSNAVVEHCLLSDFLIVGNPHVDVIYFWNATNVTMRYNVISNSPADGIYWWGGVDGGTVNFYFYNNLIVNSYGALLHPGGPTPSTAYVFNNVFYSPSTSNPGIVGFSPNTTYQCYNNVFYNTIFTCSSTNANSDGYNSYNQWAYNGYPEPTYEVGSIFNLTTNAFVGSAMGNFNLTTNSMLIGKGTNLTALANSKDLNIKIDLNGNLRPAAGNWGIGAYEYSGSVSSTNLVPPVGLLARMSLNITTNYTPLTIRASGIATNWASSLHFNFGDGSYTDFGNTNVASTIHTYASPGIYMVTLIASNNVSAISSISQVTTVTQ
jgi:PKD repeat protein